VKAVEPPHGEDLGQLTGRRSRAELKRGPVAGSADGAVRLSGTLSPRAASRPAISWMSWRRNAPASSSRAVTMVLATSASIAPRYARSPAGVRRMTRRRRSAGSRSRVTYPARSSRSRTLLMVCSSTMLAAASSRCARGPDRSACSASSPAWVMSRVASQLFHSCSTRRAAIESRRPRVHSAASPVLSGSEALISLAAYAAGEASQSSGHSSTGGGQRSLGRFRPVDVRSGGDLSPFRAGRRRGRLLCVVACAAAGRRTWDRRCRGGRDGDRPGEPRGAVGQGWQARLEPLEDSEACGVPELVHSI
jgi:hypothetical protein